MKTKKIKLLREFVEFRCEECHKHEDEAGTLEPHRIKQMGEYSLRNVKMVCSHCHNLFSAAQRIANGTQSI